MTDTFPYPGGTPEALGEASGDNTFDNDQNFSCSTDPADYTNGSYTYSQTNRAAITETGQYAEATVTVTCYAPVVRKDATTSYDRTWSWTIAKVGDQTALTLSPGQVFPVNYDVTVSATKTDSKHKVSGTITVVNPNPGAAMTVGLTDTLPEGATAEIFADADCAYTSGSLTVPAGATATCGYASVGLVGPISGNNQATVTLNAIAFSATAPVSFGAPTNEVDECIDVSDDRYGVQGTVCAGDAPKSFEYVVSVGPYDVCGDYTFTNIASFVTNDTETEGSDSWTVVVDVPCGGCTLTQGYWKTHSKYGPAPYDETWALIGEDTPFFKSGKTWYQVFWTPPAGGNVYYSLAHQYMAAQLNILNGASSTPEVDAAISWAETFFDTYKPPDRLSRQIANQARSYATLLDNYNNGLIGPGHCSELGATGSSLFDDGQFRVWLPSVRGRA